MKIISKIFIGCISLMLLLGTSLQAQQDQFGWRIGGGAAVFSYYGDLSNKVYNSDLLKYGYFIQAEKSLSPAWSLQAGYLYGKLEGNDRLFDRNDLLITKNSNYKRSLNFQTDIHAAWASFVWYADNGGLMKEWAVVAPFFKAGVGMLWFDPKADLFNEDGLRYYYWSDNTIRSIDENAPNASQAVLLEQDGDFETELSPLRTEIEGGYKKNTLYIPLAIGLKFRVSDRININLEAGLNYTFTDYLDDVGDRELRDNYPDELASYAADPAGSIDGIRGNDSKWKDMFSYAGVSMHFNFAAKRHTFTSPSIYVSTWQSRIPESLSKIDLIVDDTLSGATFQTEMIQQKIRAYNIQILEDSYRINQELQKIKPVDTDSVQGYQSPVQINLTSQVPKVSEDTLNRMEVSNEIEADDTLSIQKTIDTTVLETSVSVKTDSILLKETPIEIENTEEISTETTIDSLAPQPKIVLTSVDAGDSLVIENPEILIPASIELPADSTVQIDSIVPVTPENTSEGSSQIEIITVTDSTSTSFNNEGSSQVVKELPATVKTDTLSVASEDLKPAVDSTIVSRFEIADSVVVVPPTQSIPEEVPTEKAAAVEVPLKIIINELEKDSAGRIEMQIDGSSSDKTVSGIADSTRIRAELDERIKNEEKLNEELLQLRSSMASMQAEMESLKRSLEEQAANSSERDTLWLAKSTDQKTEQTDKAQTVISTAPVMDSEARLDIRILEDKIETLQKQLSTLVIQPSYEPVSNKDDRDNEKGPGNKNYVPAPTVVTGTLSGSSAENSSPDSKANTVTDSAVTSPSAKDSLMTDSLALARVNNNAENKEIKTGNTGNSADLNRDLEYLLLTQQMEIIRKEAALRESTDALRRQSSEKEIEILKKQVEFLTEALTKPAAPKPVETPKVTVKPISAQVFFQVNQSTLNNESRAALETLILAMLEQPNTKVSITGYADKSGNAAYNKALSEKRALSVRTYLNSRGINLSRILMSAVGEEFDESAGSGDPSYYRRVDVEILAQ